MLSHTIGSALLFVLAAMPMPAQTASPAGAHRAPTMSTSDAAALQKALAAFDDGNAAAARPDLERLATRYPGSFPANEALGILYLDAGETAHALPCLERAATAAPTDAAAQANLGAVYLQSGRAEPAVRALKRAASLDPKNAKTASSLGHALYLDKQPLEAANAFARAVALDPGSTDDAYNQALALSDAQHDAPAVAVLEHIAPAQRTDAVESLLGDLEERRGHFQQAVEHMQTAARLNPSEPNTYAVAIELLRHWSWEPALQITHFGVRQFPASRRLQMADGIAYFGAGRYTEASATFGALLTLDPDNENYGSLLGRSCTAAGGGSAAECGSLIAFAGRHPKNAQIDVSAAVSLLHQPEGASQPDDTQRRLDEAQHLLEQAIQSDPKLAEAYYQLAVLQQQRLQWKESAASLGKAVELRPTFAEAHYRLSRAYSHTGQQELARTEITLQQKYSQQEKDETNARLKEVTIFLTASH